MRYFRGQQIAYGVLGEYGRPVESTGVVQGNHGIVDSAVVSRGS